MALRGSASAASTANAASLAITVTSIGIQQYDIVFLVVQGGGSTTNTYTWPTGFVNTNMPANQNVTGDATLAAVWKVASASEPSSYTVTSSSSNKIEILCLAYSGRKTAAPISFAVAGSTTYNNNSPVTFTEPTGTAQQGDDVFQVTGCKFYDGTNAFSFTASTAGYGNAQVVYGTLHFSPCISFCDQENVTAGTTTTTGGTLTCDSRTDLGYTAWVIGVAAAPASTATNQSSLLLGCD